MTENRGNKKTPETISPQPRFISGRMQCKPTER